MKAHRYLIFILVLLLMQGLMISCEQDIHIKLPYAGDKIVLNALINNDSIVYAHITKSVPNETDVGSFPELAGCKADLYENGIFKESLVETAINSRKFYISKLKTKSGSRYNLKVSYSGLPNVEGSDDIPAKPLFTPVDYWKINNAPDSTRPYKMTIKLKDKAGEKNYYRLRIFPAQYSTATKRYTINRNSELSFGIDNFIDQSNFFGVFDDNLYRIGYFTDETFDGKEITLTLSLKVMSTERAYIAPELTALSKPCYQYFDTKNRQVQNNDNPFTEAVVVYGNIVGGYGIVGGMADSTAVIKRLN